MEDLLDTGKNSNDFRPSTVPNATGVLVLGIISIVGCIFYGIPGLICGIIALVMHKKDKALYLTNPEKYEASFKNSKAGYICAVIGLSLSALYLLLIIIFVIAGVSGMLNL